MWHSSCQNAVLMQLRWRWLHPFPSISSPTGFCLTLQPRDPPSVIGHRALFRAIWTWSFPSAVFPRLFLSRPYLNAQSVLVPSAGLCSFVHTKYLILFIHLLVFTSLLFLKTMKSMSTRIAWLALLPHRGDSQRWWIRVSFRLKDFFPSVSLLSHFITFLNLKTSRYMHWGIRLNSFSVQCRIIV